MTLHLRRSITKSAYVVIVTSLWYFSYWSSETDSNPFDLQKYSVYCVRS